MTDNLTDPFVPFKYIKLAHQMMIEQSPLNSDDSVAAVTKIERNMARAVLSAGRHHSMKKMMELKKHSGLSWMQIIIKGIVR